MPKQICKEDSTFRGASFLLLSDKPNAEAQAEAQSGIRVVHGASGLDLAINLLAHGDRTHNPMHASALPTLVAAREVLVEPKLEAQFPRISLLGNTVNRGNPPLI